MAKRKRSSLLAPTMVVSNAAQLGVSIGSSVKGRDRLTRVMSPIRGVVTHGRQWNRIDP